MKAYTSFKQSKKLAEILPIESADMCFNIHNNTPPLMIPYSRFNDFLNMSTAPDFFIPCWSLAALLDVLPPYLFEFERGIDLNVYPNLNGRGWHCSYMPNCIENMKTDKFKLITSGDTIVDACYEMIIKLHEQNFCKYGLRKTLQECS